MNLGDRIKELRQNRSWTQDELAQMVGKDRSNIASYETGRSVPHIDTISAIADLFKVSVDYLVGRVSDAFATFKSDSDLSPEEEERLQKFLSETEQLIRENANGYDEAKLKSFLKFMEFNFIEDLDPKKRDK